MSSPRLPRRIAVALIALTGAAIFFVGVRRVVMPGTTHVEVDRGVYPVHGVDISAHNGTVEFDSLAAAGIDFVYMKASEGATWRDARFEENYTGARAAGLEVGVYHFFRFDVPGWRQSVNLLNSIKGRVVSLPVAIDVEEWGNPANYTTEDVRANLRSMVELLRLNGREPIIYTNKNGYNRFVRGYFDDVDLWICSFTTPPLGNHDDWLMWQHSHSGSLPGVNGKVSFDTFNTPARGPMARWLTTRPGVSRL